jgi:hypothetical protein
MFYKIGAMGFQCKWSTLSTRQVEEERWEWTKSWNAESAISINHLKGTEIGSH